ncbi:MAG: CRISPR-associated endonuclease Cas3'' [Anaerolineae bacterium]
MSRHPERSNYRPGESVCYAHSANEAGQRQSLEGHLRAVAEEAAAFAGPLGLAEVGYYLGLWHDVGKYDPEFQQYLLDAEAGLKRRGPDHKAAGAALAVRHLGTLALAVLGHHGGLPSLQDGKLALQEAGKRPEVAQAQQRAAVEIGGLQPASRLSLPFLGTNDILGGEMLVRMLFSAFVDADALDTEQHFRPVAAEERARTVGLAELWRRFEEHQARFPSEPADVVGRVRREVYRACLAAASQPPGLFRLCVPTGGGKTLSGMGFALRHALEHGLGRVIVAVPFISITEQTADTYRAVFDRPGEPSVVLEHHSGAVTDDDDSWARLAAENWDAPIVVTTTVQLFESLFGNRPGATRKLHNLAGSVIILDEAQSLPGRLLRPILDGLGHLCRCCGASVVLSTATQPAFSAIPEFASSGEAAGSSLGGRDIVPEPERHFAALRRVSYQWPEEATSWAAVADLMRDEPQALAIVNTKKDAMALLDALEDPKALHLSTLLCGAHRRSVIAAVKQRLAAGEPCHLAATQVVEAGVDIDFPLVLRAEGPLDAIIQAAGRCNREGRLALGRTVVFRPEGGGMPKGAYSIGAQVTAAMRRAGMLDPDDPATATLYFGRLFALIETDAEQIQTLRRALDYPEVAHRFRMIDDDTVSVIVEYGSDEERQRVQGAVERLCRGAPDARHLLRQLQPYVVSLRQRQARQLEGEGFITAVMPGLGIWCGQYHPVRGLMATDPDPDKWVV